MRVREERSHWAGAKKPAAAMATRTLQHRSASGPTPRQESSPMEVTPRGSNADMPAKKGQQKRLEQCGTHGHTRAFIYLVRMVCEPECVSVVVFAHMIGRAHALQTSCFQIPIGQMPLHGLYDMPRSTCHGYTGFLRAQADGLFRVEMRDLQ